MRLEVAPAAKLHLFKVSVVQIVKVGENLRLKLIHVHNSISISDKNLSESYEIFMFIFRKEPWRINKQNYL